MTLTSHWKMVCCRCELTVCGNDEAYSRPSASKQHSHTCTFEKHRSEAEVTFKQFIILSESYDEVKIFAQVGEQVNSTPRLSENKEPLLTLAALNSPRSIKLIKSTYLQKLRTQKGSYGLHILQLKIRKPVFGSRYERDCLFCNIMSPHLILRQEHLTVSELFIIGPTSGFSAGPCTIDSKVTNTYEAHMYVCRILTHRYSIVSGLHNTYQASILIYLNYL